MLLSLVISAGRFLRGLTPQSVILLCFRIFALLVGNVACERYESGHQV